MGSAESFESLDSLGVIFSDALAEVIATVTSVYLRCEPPEKNPDEPSGSEEITGMMSLRGNKGGLLFISAKESDMRVLCSYMTGVPESEVTKDDAEDALREFVNMTAGSAKLRISDPDYMFSLSLPVIIKGKEDMVTAAKSKNHTVSRVLGNGEISVRLKFIC